MNQPPRTEQIKVRYAEPEREGLEVICSELKEAGHDFKLATLLYKLSLAAAQMLKDGRLTANEVNINQRLFTTSLKTGEELVKPSVAPKPEKNCLEHVLKYLNFVVFII